MAQALVIGAGIVGLSCAYALVNDGHAVTVLDRDPPGDKASFGNAGGIGISEVVPASAPGIIWRIPGWLADPLGPLSLRPAHVPALMPWLLRFMKAGRAAEVERIAASLAALNHRVYDDLVPMLAAIGIADELHRVGALTVYESDAAFERDGALWALKRRHGIVCEILSGDEARSLEPALAPIIRRAVMTPQWSHVSDPKRVVDKLRDWLAARGARIVAGEVVDFARDAATAVTADGRRLSCDALIVAAGAWSGTLARRLGDRALVESERGYNTTLPEPGIRLGREIIFAKRKFVATPLSIRLRIGGAAEFAGLAAAPNYQRSAVLLALALAYLPGLRDAHGTQWMGHRPTTPDSLPVIGRSPRRGNVFYAFGHGHTGLTQGPTTGRLIADLVAGRPATLDLAPYAIGRFGRS